MDQKKRIHKMDDGELDIELLSLLIKSSNLASKVREQVFVESDMTAVQFHVLIVISLSKEKRITFTDLSKKLGVSKPTVTGLIDRMEAKGLVRREANSNDRRCTEITINEKSDHMLKKIGPLSKELNLNMLNCFNRKEKELLFQLVFKFFERLTTISKIRD